MSESPSPTHSSQCLTDDEVAQVGRVDPSDLPEPLALHLANCSRCQERALFGSEPRRGKTGSTPALPSVGRALGLLALLILAMLAFFFTLGQLVGEP